MPTLEGPNVEIEKSSSISSVSSRERDDESSASISAASSEHIDVVNIPNIQRVQERQELPIYENIIIPQEPSLDELLKQVAGTSELENVTEISLRIISHMISLQRINLFMPNLVKLNLEGSIVTSFRDLGCDVRTIKILNVSRCGLKSLDGIHGLQSIEDFICDYNFIEDVTPCCGLETIRKLSLRSNYVKNIDCLSFLELCPNLRELNLLVNPVVETLDYRMIVKKYIPHLMVLDEEPFFEAHFVADVSSSDYKSSSSSTSLDSSLNELHARPHTSSTASRNNGMIEEKYQRNIRPSTAVISYPNTSSALTSGEPLCGNIVTKMKRRRRNIAWADSQESSTSSDSLHSLASSSKLFPNQLPQKSIELELGVIGITQEANTSSESISSDKLLQMAIKWREESKKTREKITHDDNVRILKGYLGTDN